MRCNKLQPNRKKAMLEYSRERVAYCLFDIECRITIEERNVTFDETQKGSCYIRQNKADNNYEA